MLIKFVLGFILLININFDPIYRKVPGTSYQIEGGVPDVLNISGFKNLTQSEPYYKSALALLSFLQNDEGTSILNTPLIVPPFDEAVCLEDDTKGEAECSRRYILKNIGTLAILKPEKNELNDLSKTFFTVNNMPIYDTWRVPIKHGLLFNRSKDCRVFGRWDVCAKNIEMPEERLFILGELLLCTFF